MQSELPLIQICEVISVDDPTDGDRIKVKLKPEDNNKTYVEELSYAFPLLPKMLHVKPKVGEAVMIITAIAGNGSSQRFYIGPVISQCDKIEKDPYFYSSRSLFRNSIQSPTPAPSLNPETHGAYPESDDISILGRRSCDVQIKPDDIRIKAGVKNSDGNFNSVNPSYVKLKYHPNSIVTTNDETKSTATIVADKINLVGNSQAKIDGYNVTDSKELIPDAEMKKLIESAHKLPYGDELIEFLKIFKDAFLKHVHPMPTMPLCTDVSQLNDYDLDSMLSDTVRIV